MVAKRYDLHFLYSIAVVSFVQSICHAVRRDDGMKTLSEPIFVTGGGSVYYFGSELKLIDVPGIRTIR